MPEYINWFVVELRLRLAPHLSMERVETLTREVESHLRELSGKNIASLGMSEERAQAVAVEAFGRPDKVALDYLRESNPRLFGIRPIWFVILGAIMAIGCWDFHWLSLDGFFDNFGATWQNGLAGIVGAFAMAGFIAGCRGGRRSFRWTILGVGAATCLGLIFVTSFWIVGAKVGRQGFNRFHLSRDETNALKMIATLQISKQYLTRGSEVFAKSRTESQIPPEFIYHGQHTVYVPSYVEILPVGDYWPPKYVVPREYGVFAMVDGRTYIFGTAHTIIQARDAWRTRSEKSVREIDREITGFRGLLHAASEARQGRLFFFNSDVYGDAIAWTIVFLPALLLLDAISFALFRRKRAWPGLEVAS